MALKLVLRKLALTAHITSSVGWFGSVAVFLSLAVAGLISQDTEMVRAAYIGMEWITRFVIVPLCLASLLTGIVSALGTEWGLFRHYWIMIKLLLTVIATIGLLVHLQPISYLAHVVAESTLSSADLRVQIQLVVIAGAALLLLLVATTLSVYKPRGMTRYGWHRQLQRRKVSKS